MNILDKFRYSKDDPSQLNIILKKDPYEKVNTEWIIDGKVYYIDQWGEKDWEYVKATVYNWKTGYTPTEEYDWHIGGNSYDAVDFIREILDGQVEPEYRLT